MPRVSVSDEEFAARFTAEGATALAAALGINERNVYQRRANLSEKWGRHIPAPSSLYTLPDYPERMTITVDDGWVLIGSDAHYWPGIVTTAHRGFVKACKKLNPKLVIANGDMFDGASISRHARIGWEQSPSVDEELEACTERLTEIERAAPNAERVWNLGNHDARFETKLANEVSEYARVKGMHLKDHFPYWAPAWSTWINNEVVVKHRIKGGIHATHNNTMWAGKTTVTGHLHSPKVTPVTDYNGTRYGVDTGMMAEPYGPQFSGYMEDNPRNWRSSFAALRFKNGRLLQPLLAVVVEDGVIDFMGDLHHV